MKTVIHVVDGKVVRQEVPDNWIQCSVLGEFRPPEEFRKEGEVYQSRTNCTRAYLMPQSEWKIHIAKLLELKPEIARMEQKLRDEMFEKTAGVSVDELIAKLESVKKQNPNARIVSKVLDEYGVTYDSPEICKLDHCENVYSIC